MISIPFSIIKHKNSARNVVQEPNMLSLRFFLLPSLNMAPTFDGEPMEHEALDHLIFHPMKVLKGMEFFYFFYGWQESGSKMLSNRLKVTQRGKGKMLILCIWHKILFKHLTQYPFPQTFLCSDSAEETTSTFRTGETQEIYL